MAVSNGFCQAELSVNVAVSLLALIINKLVSADPPLMVVASTISYQQPDFSNVYALDFSNV